MNVTVAMKDKSKRHYSHSKGQDEQECRNIIGDITESLESCKDVAYIWVEHIVYPETGNSRHQSWCWTVRKGWVLKKDEVGFSVHH